MLTFCSPEVFRARCPEGEWLYLGKDFRRRAALARVAGRPPRPAGPALHEEYARLKQPYLDFVGRLGRGRRGDARWWCSLIAGRAQASTDLFLILGYLGFCARLARERSAGSPPLTVVIEDPWALHAARAALGAAQGCRFLSPPSLFARRAALALAGLARRLWWLLRMLRSRAVLAGVTPPRADGAVLVYSHLIARSLTGTTGWTDPFLPGLQEELQAAGATVLRPTYPDATGLEREAAARASYLIPLIVYARWRDFFRLLLEVPPALPEKAELEGLPIGILLEREWWHDFSRRGRQAYLLLYETARRMFAAGRARALVFSWENQPQDKMLMLAAREAGVRCVGSQTTTVPRFQLPFYLGTGEHADAPLPDRLLVTGRHAVEALGAGGIPVPVLRDGGARRYGSYLRDQPLPRRPVSGDVLIVLPVDRYAAWMMLEAVAAAYPDAGRDFKFYVRPHPSDPIDLADIPFPVEDGGGPMESMLERCGVMLFSGSTVGIDGLLGGRRVLRHRPDAAFDMDPCDMFDESIIPATDDAGLRGALEALRSRNLETLPPGTLERLRYVFSPVDGAVWRDAVLKL